MEIIETPIFTKMIQTVMSDESYRAFQSHLIESPDSGAIILGSGGLRKIRWKGASRGKRGGMRVIYYWYNASGILLMLYAYSKNVQDDLTKEQLKTLKKIILAGDD